MKRSEVRSRLNLVNNCADVRHGCSEQHSNPNHRVAASDAEFRNAQTATPDSLNTILELGLATLHEFLINWGYAWHGV